MERTRRNWQDSLFADLLWCEFARRRTSVKTHLLYGTWVARGLVAHGDGARVHQPVSKTKTNGESGGATEEGAQFAAPVAEPESATDARLETATDEALAELSSEDRFTLAAYYLDGRTLAEIARALGLHESSVSRRLDRLSTGLRKRILAGLRAQGMSHAQAAEALETDVRDLQLNLRSRLMQDLETKTFPGGKTPFGTLVKKATEKAMTEVPEIVYDRLRAAVPAQRGWTLSPGRGPAHGVYRAGPLRGGAGECLSIWLYAKAAGRLWLWPCRLRSRWRPRVRLRWSPFGPCRR